MKRLFWALVFLTFLSLSLFSQAALNQPIKETNSEVSAISENFKTLEKSENKESEKYRFYSALKQKTGADFITNLEGFVNSQNKLISQTAHLELAKVLYLKSFFYKSQENLQLISIPDLVLEKSYWQSRSLFKLKDYKKAIWEAQNYITESDNQAKIENSYLLIAQSYMELGQHALALEHLNYLRATDLIVANYAFLLYQVAQCYETLGDNKSAVFAYGELIRDYPASKYALLAKGTTLAERIEKLQKSPPKVSFVKTDKKGTYFLQAGAFKDSTNAQKRSLELEKLGYLPKRNSKLVDSSFVYKITIGPFDTIDKINQTRSFLKNSGISSFLAKENSTPIKTTQKHYLQAGVFSNFDNVRRMVKRLGEIGFEANSVQKIVGEKKLYYVLVGPYDSIELAKENIQRLKTNQNIESVLFIR